MTQPTQIFGDVLKTKKQIAEYWNPYVAGVLLGLVLLASFLVAGRGLGASGVTSQILAHGFDALSLDNEYLQSQKSNDSLADSWILFEVVGMFLGAFFSAKQSGRSKKEITKGSSISNKKRLISALIGGLLMGFAARLARGCTSGQALTGGALLNAGSWLFMIAVFIGAYLAIIYSKRNWQ